MYTSSWIETRALPCLWYQVDAGDADPATFFHYLGLAGLHRARGRRVLLPPLVPELLPGLELYARRYFEELFGLYSEPFVVVFDNCHEVPREAPFATVLLSTLFDSLPSHGYLLCLSRGPLPPPLVRCSADPSFQRIDFEDLSFTDPEAIALAEMVAPGLKDVAERCNRTAHGWVMGLKLLLGAPANEPRPTSSVDKVASPAIFDYYATEVLARAPLAVRQLLMRAAVLEDMEPSRRMR